MNLELTERGSWYVAISARLTELYPYSARSGPFIRICHGSAPITTVGNHEGLSSYDLEGYIRLPARHSLTLKRHLFIQDLTNDRIVKLAKKMEKELLRLAPEVKSI